jgi:diacylglycerol kinase family enzyme
MKGFAVINAESGSVSGISADELCAEVKNRLSQVGIEATVRCEPPDGLSEAMDQAGDSEAEVLVVGGGDGTVRHAARTAMEGEMALAVVPMGTMNIFARDLGLPMDWREAMDALGDADQQAVDTGQLNGMTFLCQSSIGLVPRLAEQREKVRSDSWLWSLLAMPRRIRQVWSTVRKKHLALDIDEKSVATKTWMAVVTNNLPDKPLALMPQRTRLDQGVLAVHWAKVKTRLGLFWLVLSYVLNAMGINPQVQVQLGRQVNIQGYDGKLKIDLDGEIMELKPPLHYEIRPRSLRVLVPRAGKERPDRSS